jgi:hypothetical protein
MHRKNQPKYHFFELRFSPGYENMQLKTGRLKSNRGTDLIPERIQRLFWDTDKKSVDLRTHRAYVIRRIMDYGNLEDVSWMLATYSVEEIIEVLKKSRGLSRKSGYFWGNRFAVPKEEIACLQAPYRKRPTPF